LIGSVKTRIAVGEQFSGKRARLWINRELCWKATVATKDAERDTTETIFHVRCEDVVGNARLRLETLLTAILFTSFVGIFMVGYQVFNNQQISQRYQVTAYEESFDEGRRKFDVLV